MSNIFPQHKKEQGTNIAMLGTVMLPIQIQG